MLKVWCVISNWCNGFDEYHSLNSIHSTKDKAEYHVISLEFKNPDANQSWFIKECEVL